MLPAQPTLFDLFMAYHLDIDRIGEALGLDNRVIWRVIEDPIDVLDLLFGTSGSVRMRNLLQYRLEIPHYPGDPMKYLMNNFLEAVRACFRKDGLVQEDRGRETFDRRFLLGFEHELYIVGNEYNICRPADSSCAVGSGEEYTYGSFSTTEQMDIEPLQRLTLALEAAAHYNTDVCAPFTFVTSREGAYEE